MRIGAIIQARMGSTRLSGKVLKELSGKTVLEHVIERVSQSQYLDEIIVATTTSNKDDEIVEEMQRIDVKIFRGSEEDVLSRYYYAAKENQLDVVVRITSDCPLIDPNVIDLIIEAYMENQDKIVSNAGAEVSSRTYPRGLDTEIFSYKFLKEAYEKAKEKYQREHVTPYMYENKVVYYFKGQEDLSKYRWTLDTKEDFELISRVYDRLYKGIHDFYLEKILELFEEDEELIMINAHIEQKKLMDEEC